jgi:hypothetical protein
MKYPWLIYAYWRPREESAAEVAKRLGRFLALASTLGPNHDRWFKAGISKKREATNPVLDGNDIAALERLVSKNALKDDFGRPVIYGGYSLGLYNGAPYDRYVYCGVSAGYNPTHGRSPWPNNTSFQLQCDLSTFGFDNDRNLKTFMEVVISVWEPDWAVVFRSGPPEPSVRKFGDLYLDKMTWVGPARLAEASVLTGDGVTVEEVAGGLLFNRLQVLEDG